MQEYGSSLLTVLLAQKLEVLTKWKAAIHALLPSLQRGTGHTLKEFAIIIVVQTYAQQ